MLDGVVRVAAGLLALLFAWSAAAKVIRFGSWRSELGGYALPRPLRRVALGGVPVLEAAVVALVLVGELPPAGALCIASVSAFSLAILRRRSVEGDRFPCACFGRSTTRDYRVMLSRNLLVAVMGAVVMLGGSGVSVFDGLRAPGPGELLPAVLVVAGVTLITWMVVQASTSLRRKATR
jgi:uncharacterized membrane protein YphA (DoxX/SURF4 family)